MRTPQAELVLVKYLKLNCAKMKADTAPYFPGHVGSILRAVTIIAIVVGCLDVAVQKKSYRFDLALIKSLGNAALSFFSRSRQPDDRSAPT